ncbi:hypothetical protein EXIGLDRAFT_809511 [Exidia glandulosa HHB12029]|uniref:Novel STAND NTPase 1 domain-containing protein n=1 Tax=Exidia glandulosa HHB12029 TaxID=1314781 RepID=A0A165CU14_EXIGL|nr:hypothetical protein EXIGLDRAFT_809511 [Exidia glandulosa HHB12029]
MALEDVVSSAAGLTEDYTRLLSAVKTNRDVATALIGQLSRFASALSAASGDSTDDSAMGHARKEFMDYLARVLTQRRDAEVLAGLSERLQTASAIFKTRAKMQISDNAAIILNLYQKLEAAPAASETVPVGVEPRMVTVAEDLPPRPQLFFGRQEELEVVVGALTTGTAPARLAILGGPGMGKTTLAVAAIHDPVVSARFSTRRYFVPCDLAEGRSSSCLHLVASAFGVVDNDASTIKKNLDAILNVAHSPSFLVLDNFESAWEPLGQRAEAESLLQFLSNMSHLSLLVTMRGAERPHGVLWTKPHLPAMGPLNMAAAIQTFVAISDIDENDSDLPTLMGYLGNVPLAVTLGGNLAQCEPIGSLLARWQEARTAIIARGGQDHRLASLDVSIALSLRSSRVKDAPGAQALLSLLALLPSGVMDTDIDLWELAHSKQALSALLRSSLATRTPDGRIQVLAPIREYILANFAPLGQ